MHPELMTAGTAALIVSSLTILTTLAVTWIQVRLGLRIYAGHLVAITAITRALVAQFATVLRADVVADEAGQYSVHIEIDGVQGDQFIAPAMIDDIPIRIIQVMPAGDPTTTSSELPDGCNDDQEDCDQDCD